jgi:hypothetical protein
MKYGNHTNSVRVEAHLLFGGRKVAAFFVLNNSADRAMAVSGFRFMQATIAASHYFPPIIGRETIWFFQGLEVCRAFFLHAAWSSFGLQNVYGGVV